MGAESTRDETELVVLMPVLDDWESATVLVGRVHAALLAEGVRPAFLLVDDGSSLPAPEVIGAGPGAPRVEILHLRRNLGHQRAIAIGLSVLHARRGTHATVVMDADGEDTAEGVVALWRAFKAQGGARTVFAARARRTEGVAFRSAYQVFRVIHWLLTGRTVRVGNFSIVPSAHVERLVAVSELWNHYAASVFKARLPTHEIAVDRGWRIAGQSRMNFVSLLAHGLSAISVFSDVVGLRLLVGTGLLGAIAVVGLALVVGVRLVTDLAIPGWATVAAGVLFLVLLQASLMATVFVFIVLHGRSALGFLPIRDHAYFVASVREVGARG